LADIIVVLSPARPNIKNKKSQSILPIKVKEPVERFIEEFDPKA